MKRRHSRPQVKGTQLFDELVARLKLKKEIAEAERERDVEAARGLELVKAGKKSAAKAALRKADAWDARARKLRER